MNIKEAIERLVEEVVESKTNDLKIIDLGQIENDFHKRLLKEINEDLDSFLVSIDSYSIRHSLNRHGQENELNNTQLPIENSDFVRLTEVVFKADLILKDERKGKKSVLFHKHSEVIFIAIFEIRQVTSKKKKKQSRIMLQTLYKKKPSNN